MYYFTQSVCDKFYATFFISKKKKQKKEIALGRIVCVKRFFLMLQRNSKRAKTISELNFNFRTLKGSSTNNA